MTSNHNGLLPAGDQAGNVLADDGLSEHCASKDVPDSSIRRLPHLLQVELYTGGY